jgi:hypothetical protein
MGLFSDNGDITTVVRPNQINGAGDAMALAIAQYTGVVEGTIARKSALEGFIQRRPVRGTNTLTNYAVGEATLGKVTPGEAPAASAIDFNKASITVDTLVYARNVIPLLDTFLTAFDARQEVGMEHGKKIAKFVDQAFFIQAAKAAAQSGSTFSGTDGHYGGTTQTLTNGADASDPALLYAAIGSMLEQMEEKDVDPRTDDVILAVKPAAFYTLQDAEQIVNGMYLTSAGNRLEGVPIFKAWGIPVISSNNVPSTNISGHLLSNSNNSNAYDGDFTKLVALAMSPRALLAGETIPLSSDVFYDKVYKSWFVDSHLSFAVTPNRAEYAGQVVKP